MKKHAYLIIANRNFDQLQILLSLLDDYRNDIYILIDKTSAEERISLVCNKSTLYMLPEIPIYWGDFSQVQAELNLFKSASSSHYDYYHLISGLDLPLVSQEKLHNFFDSHPHQEFVTYSAIFDSKKLSKRLRHHLFTKHFRIDATNVFTKLFFRIYRKIENFYFDLTTNINKDIKLCSNWCSLDDNFVQDLVTDKNISAVKKKFSHGFCVDEIFLSYELSALDYESKVYYPERVHDKPNEIQGNLRYINWWDGSPYTWRRKDILQLQNAVELGHLFSRKFDIKVDSEIINLIIKDFDLKE